MSHAAVARRFPAGALALAALATIPAALHAQHVVGADVNALAETGAARQPLFFPSAATLPGGRLTLSLQAVGAREAARYSEGSPVESTDTDALLATGGAAWGVTSRLTLGAYLATARADVTARYAALPSTGVAAQVIPEPDGPPTRQGTRTGIAGGEAGVHARLALWRSATGATRVTATARLRDRADEAVGRAAGLALQQRVGRATLHLAPSAWFIDDRIALEVNGAAAFALGDRLGITGEVLHHRNRRGYTTSTTELATGLRYRVGPLAVDAGVRHLVGMQSIAGDESVDRNSLLLATHLSF